MKINRFPLLGEKKGLINSEMNESNDVFFVGV